LRFPVAAVAHPSAAAPDQQALMACLMPPAAGFISDADPLIKNTQFIETGFPPILIAISR